MGCDIHMVLETKHNDKWVGIRDYDGLDKQSVDIRANDYKRDVPDLYPYIGFKCRNRNYQLFAELAGVRGHGPDPRGVPDDASDLARMHIDQWSGDGHSHSWGLLSEIGGLFAAFYFPDKVLTEDRVEAVGSFFNLPWTSSTDLSDYRLVYWFDN